MFAMPRRCIFWRNRAKTRKEGIFVRLFEEIVARLGLDEEIVSGEKYVVFPGRCAYFENVKGIRSFSSAAVAVRIGKIFLRAEGENLHVRQYCGGDLVLFGDVRKVEVVG